MSKARTVTFDRPIRLEPGFFNVCVDGGTSPYQLQRWTARADKSSPWLDGFPPNGVDPAIVWEDDQNAPNDGTMVVRGGSWIRVPAGATGCVTRASN